MKARDSQSAREMEDRATDWIARRNAGLTKAEEQELAAWRAADARHEAAFAGVEAVWRALQEPRRRGQAEAVWAELDLPRRLPTRRQAAWLSFAAVGAVAAFLFFLGVFRARPVEARAPTIIVRPDRQVLPDGSTVELNANAEIAIDFTERRRAVRLLRGEALFHVKKDPSRPFVVSARDVAVHAVGTAFAVRMEQDQIGVLVTEGRVAVRQGAEPESAPVAPANAPAPTYVDAGAQLVVPAAAPPLAAEPVSAAGIAQALAWRERRFEFIDTPLPTALKLFNEHNPVRFVLVDGSLQQRSLTGIFWSDDPDTFARLLEAGFSIKAERTGDEILLHDSSRLP